MKKLIPILLVLLSAAGGAAAGFFLKPSTETADAGPDGTSQPPAPDPAQHDGSRAFVKIGRQTIVPVLEGGETRALMLFELAVDVPTGQTPMVHEREPRIRDAFLRELFKMSHTGAFLVDFTDDKIIDELRRNLTRVAREELGADVREVLILDVMRQEL